MRRYRADIAAIILLALAVGIFFFRLFFPVPQMIVTPDFGRSDVWHSSFAMKYILSQSLHNRTLPLWRNDLGDGVPLLSEGETGTFFLPNLIAFAVFPPALAYNIVLVLCMLTFLIGTYASCRLLHMHPTAAWFSAIILGFSGLPILNLTHIALLQGMSMMPLLFALTILLIERGAFPWMAILALGITQQFFAGFPQASFLTWILMGSYVVWHAITKRSMTHILLFPCALILGTAGAAAQLLPSREYLTATGHPTGFDFTTASQYSMPFTHLLSFIKPFAFGDPKLGTYPPFFAFDGSVFWENTAYFGLLPLFFIIIAFIRGKHTPLRMFFSLLTLTGLLMAWGKHSPAYIFYTFWPFNLFRVPSRFLWLAVVGLTYLAGMGVDALIRHKPSRVLRAIVLLSLLVSFADVTSTFWNYHMLIPVGTLLNAPAVITFPDKERIYTLGYGVAHNKEFISQGWQHPNLYVSLYRNAFSPDANPIFNVSQHDVYLGRNLYRSDLMDSLVRSSLNQDAKEATLSSHTILDLLSIRSIVSYIPIHSDSLQETSVTPTDGGMLRLYTNNTALPRAYIAYEATAAGTLSEAASRIFDPTFTPGKTVLLESRDIKKNIILKQFISQTAVTHTGGSVNIVSDTHSKVEIAIRHNPAQGLLILTDTYYPGWNGYIDGEPTPIYPANVKQRAIIVPQGDHTVSYVYRPQSVSTGLTISIIAGVVTALLVVAPFRGWRLYTLRKTHLPS